MKAIRRRRSTVNIIRIPITGSPDTAQAGTAAAEEMQAVLMPKTALVKRAVLEAEPMGR